MLRRARVVACVIAVLGITGSALAQMAPSVSVLEASTPLLSSRDVQNHLKLTPNQIQRIQAAFQEYSRTAQELAANAKDQKSAAEAQKKAQQAQINTAHKAINILNADQRKRLREIGVQIYGPFSVMAKDLKKELGVTVAQEKKIKDIQERTVKEANAVTQATLAAAQKVPQPKDKNDKKAMQDYSDRLKAAMEKRQGADKAKLDSIKKKGEADVLKVLTDAQRKKLKEFQGAPFPKITK